MICAMIFILVVISRIVRLVWLLSCSRGCYEHVELFCLQNEDLTIFSIIL